MICRSFKAYIQFIIVQNKFSNVETESFFYCIFKKIEAYFTFYAGNTCLHRQVLKWRCYQQRD